MKSKDITFGFCNMRSLKPKMGAVNRFVRNKKIDIFVMVETGLFLLMVHIRWLT